MTLIRVTLIRVTLIRVTLVRASAATLPGVAHDAAVISQRADQRMLFQPRQRELLRGLAVQQFADDAEPEFPVRQGDFAGSFHQVAGVFLGQRPQAQQHTRALDAARREHRFRPLRRVRADHAHVRQQARRSVFQTADLLRCDMFRLRAEAALLVPRVHRDLLEALIEDPHHPRVPTRPDRQSQILRRHGVIRLGDFHVTVAADDPLSFLEHREPLTWQRQQRGLLDLDEHLADLPLRRAVDPRVGDALFPIAEEAVLLFETAEGPRLQCIPFDVANPTLDLSLVTRRVRLRRQDHRAVVLSERLQLRHQLRIKPIRMRHRGSQIVDHHRLRHTAKEPERILQTTQELVRRLLKHRLAVRLPRVRQHHPEDRGLPLLTVRQHDRRAGPKIDLHLFTRSTLQPPHRQWPRGSQPLNESPHAVIADRRVLLAH